MQQWAKYVTTDRSDVARQRREEGRQRTGMSRSAIYRLMR